MSPINSPQAHAELLRTGFEYPNLLTDPEAVPYGPIYFRTCYAGVSPEVDGWALLSGSVDIVRHLYPTAAEGDQTLDLNGWGAGAIGRTFATVPGQQYTFSFKHSGNPIGGYGHQMVLYRDQVQWDVIEWNPLDEGNSYEIDMRFKCREYSFTAEAEVTTISLVSSYWAPSGPVLDDLRFGPAFDDERLEPEKIEGAVWSDLDADGTRGSKDRPLEGVVVKLVFPGGERMTQSDADGKFYFDRPGPRVAWHLEAVPPLLSVAVFDSDGLESPNAINGGAIGDCTPEFGYRVPRVEYVSKDLITGEWIQDENIVSESVPYPTCVLEVVGQRLISQTSPDAAANQRYSLEVDVVVRLRDTLGELPEFPQIGIDALRFTADGRLIQTRTGLAAQAQPVSGDEFWRVRDSSLAIPVTLTLDRIRPGPVTLAVKTDGNAHGRRAQAAVTFNINRSVVPVTDRLGNSLAMPGPVAVLDPDALAGPAGEEHGLVPYAIRVLVPVPRTADALNRAKTRWNMNGADLRLVSSGSPDASYLPPPEFNVFYFRTGNGATPDRFVFGERFEPRFCPAGVYAQGEVAISVVSEGQTLALDRRPILKEDRGPAGGIGIGIAARSQSAAPADAVTLELAAAAAPVVPTPRYTLADVLTQYYLLYDEPGLQMLDWFLEGRETAGAEVSPLQPEDMARIGTRATVRLGSVKGVLDWDGWKVSFPRPRPPAPGQPVPPLRAEIVVERDFPNAVNAAVALSEALQSLKGAAIPLEFNLDLATINRLMDLAASGMGDGSEATELADYWRNYTLTSVREPMVALEQAIEFGVSINPIAGGAIGLSYAYDELRKGNDLKAGLQAALSVLPVVGMAGRGGLRLAALEVSVFAADLSVPVPAVLAPAVLAPAETVEATAVRLAAPRYLRARVFLQGPSKQAFIPIARQFNQRIRSGISVAEARTQMMAEMRNVLDIGNPPSGQGIHITQLRAMVDAGLVPTFGKSTSRSYARRLYQYVTGASDEVHHWLPLQQEVQFLANGIDPNEIQVLEVLDKTRHRPMHNASRYAPGGPLNAAWAQFFPRVGALPGPNAILLELDRIRYATRASPIGVFDLDGTARCWVFRFIAREVQCP